MFLLSCKLITLSVTMKNKVDFVPELQGDIRLLKKIKRSRNIAVEKVSTEVGFLLPSTLTVPSWQPILAAN